MTHTDPTPLAPIPCRDCGASDQWQESVTIIRAATYTLTTQPDGRLTRDDDSASVDDAAESSHAYYVCDACGSMADIVTAADIEERMR